MSNSSRTDRSSALGRLPDASIAHVVREPIAGVAFWAAVALPFLYLPLLAAGLDTTRLQAAFLVLLALNVVTLLIGHSYQSE